MNAALISAMVALMGLSDGPAPASAPPSPRAYLANASSWFYQLQKVDIEALRASDYDVIVMDLEDDERRVWQPRVIESLRKNGDKRRIVLAYISVGEAERYRSYWRPEWNRRRPKWIGRENRHWKGNYAVKYWSTEWREVLFRFGGLFDQAIGAGFDGVYLDRLDAYMDWGPTGRGRKHRQASGAAMVQLVQDIAQHTRKARSMPEFVIVGQNAPLLCEYPDYVATVDAVALEDLFYYRKRKRDGARRGRKYTRFILDTIAPLRTAGKPIFVVDYLPKAGYRKAYAKKTAPHTLIPFAAPSRALDRLP